MNETNSSLEPDALDPDTFDPDTFDMEAFVDRELGAAWTLLPDMGDGATHAAVRTDLCADDFTCNVVVRLVDPTDARQVRTTIPPRPVLLSSDGLDGDGPVAELLLVDEVSPTTQWIGYRFAHTPPIQIVVSAATADWPAIAGTVARLGANGRHT